MTREEEIKSVVLGTESVLRDRGLLQEGELVTIVISISKQPTLEVKVSASEKPLRRQSRKSRKPLSGVVPEEEWQRIWKIEWHPDERRALKVLEKAKGGFTRIGDDGPDGYLLYGKINQLFRDNQLPVMVTTKRGKYRLAQVGE